MDAATREQHPVESGQLLGCYLALPDLLEEPPCVLGDDLRTVAVGADPEGVSPGPGASDVDVVGVVPEVHWGHGCPSFALGLRRWISDRGPVSLWVFSFSSADFVHCLLEGG